MASNYQAALDRERNPGLDDIKALSKELADIARMVEAAKADGDKTTVQHTVVHKNTSGDSENSSAANTEKLLADAREEGYKNGWNAGKKVGFMEGKAAGLNEQVKKDERMAKGGAGGNTGANAGGGMRGGGKAGGEQDEGLKSWAEQKGWQWKK